MPEMAVNGRQLDYEVFGRGSETVVFSHGFLMNRHMFDHQIEALAKRYRIVAFDHRGHGRSDACRTPFGMDDLVTDAVALIHEICDGAVHFAGMSTGGFVGLRLLLKHPGLLKSLTLIDTAASAEDPALLSRYRLMLTALRLVGFRPLLPQVMRRLMGPAIRSDPARRPVVQQWRAAIRDLDARSIYQFGHAIFGRDDVLDALPRHPAIPVLILVGEDDAATPVARSKDLHRAMAGSILKVLPGAGHTSPVETPERVNAEMMAFLSKLADGTT